MVERLDGNNVGSSLYKEKIVFSTVILLCEVKQAYLQYTTSFTLSKELLTQLVNLRTSAVSIALTFYNKSITKMADDIKTKRVVWKHTLCWLNCWGNGY